MALNPDQVPMARPARLGRKRRGDQRQAARHEQRAADALQRARRNQRHDSTATARTAAS